MPLADVRQQQLHHVVVTRQSDFDRARREIVSSGSPGSGDDLLGMQEDIDEYLGRSPLLREVAVRATESPEALLEVTATAEAGVTGVALELELSRIWDEGLRYEYRSAAICESDKGQTRLRAVTQLGEQSSFISVSVTVERA